MRDRDVLAKGATLTAVGSPSAVGPTGEVPKQDLPEIDEARYRREREVARGGLGRISAATDERIGRRVAIKEVLDPERLTSAGYARFAREALVTARLQHPAIVPVYEVGTWPGGEPFFAMKLVDGRPLAEVIEATRSLDERLALVPNVIAVADAVAYAHERKIIHRDLKPSNVLVGAFGETVVIDWGLAKDLGETEASPASGLTVAGSVIGTPGYMAPEQASGANVDERADVYALGAILYQVLAGRPPYIGASASEILKLAAAGAPEPIATHAPGLPVDLVAIVEKAMARAPEARYPSAKELAADLRRFAAGQLVAAHHYTRLQRIARFVRRHRAPLAIAVAGAVALAALGIVSAQRILDTRDRAQAEAARADAAQARETARADEQTLANARELVHRDPTAALAALTTLSPSFAKWGAARTIAADALAHGAPRVLVAQGPLLQSLAFSGDGKTLVASGDAPALQTWDVATGTLHPLPGHRLRIVTASVLADGVSVLTTSFDHDVRLWNLTTGSSRVIATIDGGIPLVRASADGKRVILAGGDRKVRVIDVASGDVKLTTDEPILFVPGRDELVSRARDGSIRVGTKVVAKAPHTAITDVTADGRNLLVGGEETSGVMNLQTGARRDTRFAVQTALASPDGKRVAFGGRDGDLVVWSLDGGKDRALRGHNSTILALAWSPDGKALASSDAAGDVRLWDLATGTWRDLHSHSAAVGALAFSPDGTILASSSIDHTVRLWPVAGDDTITNDVIGHDPTGTIAVTTTPDGLAVVDIASGARKTFTGPPLARVEIAPDRRDAIGFAARDPDPEYAAKTFDEHAAKTIDVEFDPNVQRELVAIDLASGERRALGKAGVGLPVAWSADSRSFALPDGIGSVRIWEYASGESRALEKAASRLHSLAFSPDGERLAGTTTTGELVMWDVATGSAHVVGRHRDRAVLAWSPSGAQLASASYDRTIGLWDRATGTFSTFERGGICFAVAFSRDASQLASCCGADGFQVRDLARGQERTYPSQFDACKSIDWSEDGQQILTGVMNGWMRIFDLATGESRAVGDLRNLVEDARWLPDHRAVVFAGGMLVTRDDLPTDPAGLRAAIARELAAREPPASTR